MWIINIRRFIFEKQTCKSIKKFKIMSDLKDQKLSMSTTNSAIKIVADYSGGIFTKSFCQDEIESLSYQISGHLDTVLKHKNFNCILKQVQKEPRGNREIEFYKRVFQQQEQNENNIKEPTFLLKNLIPKFYGVVNLTRNGDNRDYLVLEDMAAGFKQLCMADIKIGTITWDPFASEEKIIKEKSKYLGTKTKLGLSLTGMHYYDITDKKDIKYGKEFGKNLNEITFPLAIRDFLNCKRPNDSETVIGSNTNTTKIFLIRECLKKLKMVKEFFNVQRDFCFYSSSLLIAYDVQKLLLEESSKLMDNDINTTTTIINKVIPPSQDWIKIYMIDFTHVFSSKDNNNKCGSLDENYIKGLDHLINIFSSIYYSYTKEKEDSSGKQL